MVQPPSAEACAFPIEDRLAGQVVGVAVALKDATIDLESVKDWLKTRISPHKFPTRWFAVDSIPRDPRGKVNRGRVADSCLRKAVR